jgi:hypothetical protein
MNFAVISLNNEKYQELADLTWHQNKVIYSESHGYGYACKTEGFYGVHMGFEKYFFIRDLFVEYPELDWVWFSDSDAMITNMQVKLEDKIDNNYHFIITTDCHGFNTGSFLFRNSDEGRKFLDLLISKQPEYNDDWDGEQKVVANLCGFPGTNEPEWQEIEGVNITNEFKSIVKVVPQKYLNSYNCEFYPHQKCIDRLGTSANWGPEDLLIHWPGFSMEQRINFAKFYMQFANRSLITI